MFNIENVNLLSNLKVNPKNLVVYKKNTCNEVIINRPRKFKGDEVKNFSKKR